MEDLGQQIRPEQWKARKALQQQREDEHIQRDPWWYWLLRDLGEN